MAGRTYDRFGRRIGGDWPGPSGVQVPEETLGKYVRAVRAEEDRLSTAGPDKFVINGSAWWYPPGGHGVGGGRTAKEIAVDIEKQLKRMGWRGGA